MPVHRCVAGAFGQLRVSDSVDFLPGQKRVEPAQFALVSLIGRLVGGLLEKFEDCVLPIPLRPVAKLLKSPRLGLQLVVEFFGLGFAVGLSASTYSLAVGR